MLNLKVKFQNSKGLNLYGLLTQNIKRKKGKIVLLLHGIRSSKNSEFYKDLISLLSQRNIPNFVFDFSAHGESEGEFKNFTISQAIDDANAAINFLKRNGYKSFIIVGSSFGGYIATVIGSKEKNIQSLLLRAPVLDYLRLIKERTRNVDLTRFRKKGFIYYAKNRKLYWKFYYDIISNKYDAKKGILKIKCPIVVIHGDSDKVVPFQHSVDICGCLENCKLIKIEGGDHRLLSPNIKHKILKILTNEIIKIFNLP